MRVSEPRTEPTEEQRASSIRSIAAALVRHSAPLRGMVVAGAISGFIAAGIGSRIVMRVIALLNDDRTGAMTDASVTVGTISVRGTLVLLVLGSIAGVLGGILYLGLRRWLWVPVWGRGPAYALVTLLTVGHLLFDPANVDFQMFEPPLAVIVLFAALFLVNGVILVALADRIHPEPAYPPSARVRAVAAGAIVLVSVVGFVGMVDTFRTIVADAGTCYSAAGGGNGCAVLERDVPGQ